MFVKPFKGGEGPYVRATDIDAISLAWDSRCLGKVSQIWARALVSINDNKNETDLEPGSDMWVGPLKPNN